MAPKPKLSLYWASSCGGCEIAVVNLHEKLLDVDRAFDFIFCPCLLDTKTKDLEAMPDQSIALTLFNGAIRTEENLEMARLLRRKSAVLVAFGSCACEGGIPALSNLHARADHFRSIYLDNPSIDNPAGVLPQCRTRVPEGELELPAFFETVGTLAGAVPVDYFIPGCPPEPHQIWNVVEALIEGRPLPPPGSVVGAGRSSVCDECKRHKQDKQIAGFHRTFEIVPDPERCLLEQGLVCLGVATRDGCGALCPQVNMPCAGCYGPCEGVRDQAGKMIGALGSIAGLGQFQGVREQQIAQKADALFDTIPDPAGTFLKFGVAGSLLARRAQ